ncbi:MAG: M24 family metallopeptidase [Holosporales bacterium]|jgi:Xaa-Pro aminopeptidase|nr:M24 family metallopeptidase [Holosporales bacterium]
MNMDYTSNLQKLRNSLAELGGNAIVVAINNSFGNFDDEVSNLTQISGFSGSNGRAVVTAHEAVLCVDGRYVNQANKQVDTSIWEVCIYPSVTTTTLLSRMIKKDQTLAVGPFSITHSSYLSILKLSKEIGFNVKVLDEASSTKLFGIPTPSNTKLFLMNEADVGESHGDRIDRIRNAIDNGEAVLLTEKPVTGWCTGMRLQKVTSDKSVLPACAVYIAHTGKPIVFCDLELKEASDDFSYVPLSSFKDVMSTMDKVTVNCNFATIPVYFPWTLQSLGFQVQQSKVDVGQFESIKNQVEISNLRTAAELTSIAFIKALAYVETCPRTTEVGVIEVFETALRKNEAFMDMSFNAISSFGENTSIVHYNPKTLGSIDIDRDGLFLFDAGAHFTSATTDMTRVIYRGNSLTREMVDIYTTVLKSVIMLSSARFPDKTKAACLDSIARFLVWRKGFDYNFGTGHGVGSFGNVHEHPSISQGSNERITNDMVFTVEPGIYKLDFGVRLENMLRTVASPTYPGYIEFETLNFIPFCKKLIDAKRLDSGEREWLNSYHALIYKKFSCAFADDPATLSWLKENTKEI